MRNNVRTMCLLTVLLIPIFGYAKEYNIIDFGAVSDTNILSTTAIQAAIDQCELSGGGKVTIPAGKFKTGSLFLKSNVNLYIENGAILFGSRDLKDYTKVKPSYISLRTQEATIQLIYAENAHNVSITGHGEIDGQGSGFKKLNWNDEGITRPHLLRFITCENIVIENITLRNSGCWMQHYLACDKVQLRGVQVFNRNNFNNDGLDLDGCHNVTVSDFISDSDDDGITLKSTSPRSCENISITNCIISSRCNAIKMGTESNGGFKNISISNCVVKPSDIKEPTFFGEEIGTSAISLEIVDGGLMEGISISNIQVDGTESPIFIRLANRARPYQKDMLIDHIGALGNISICNIRAKNTGKYGCSITGQPGFPVKNIHLSNIVLEFAGGGTLDDLHKTMEDKPKDYPEAVMFGTLPAYGFYISHASNITFSGVQFSTMEKDLRPALYLNDVQKSTFNTMHIQSYVGNDANIFLKENHDIQIKNSAVNGNSSCFVKLEGMENSEIYLINNLLMKSECIFRSDNKTNVVVAKGNISLQN